MRGSANLCKYINIYECMYMWSLFINDKRRVQIGDVFKVLETYFNVILIHYRGLLVIKLYYK